MKKHLLFISALALSPAIAPAEATGGYSYGSGNDIGGIVFVGMLVLVAIIGVIFMKRRGRK